LFGGLIVVGLLLGGVFAGCTSPASPGPDTSPTLEPTPSGEDYVELVYFHRTQRCHSCRYAGDMTQQTVETYFADALADGRLVFKILDVQDPANAEAVEKYGPYGSSLFIDTVKDGHDNIRAITAIWYNIDNDEKFVAAVKVEVAAALESI